MPLEPRVKRFLDALSAGKRQDVATASVAERREALAGLMSLSGPEIAVGDVEQRTIEGRGGALALRVYSPSDVGTSPMPGILYLHGGGFVAGSLDTHDAIARAITRAGDCRVVSVGYRLAPEHPFPAALDDALCAVRHVAGAARTFGIDPDRLAIGGDSAGGTLAAAACTELAAAGGPRLAFLLLLCPILDYGRKSPSRLEFASGYLVDEATLEHDLRHYLTPGVNSSHPAVSPLLAADLAGFPPTYLHTAECDPLRDEGHAFAERLRATGIDVSYTCHAGMIHLFYGLGAVIPYAHVAYRLIGAQIRTAFAAGAESTGSQS